MMKQPENNKPTLGGVTIKTESGTSTSPVMQRLPSLRPPRDLSLSAYSQKNLNLNQSKNKKTYVPNLNVQRNKTSENVTIKTEPIKPNLPEKNEKRSKGKKTLVQLNQGVFAEGIPGQRNVGRGRSSGGGDKTDNTLRKPTLKLQGNFKVDKQEEENTMKQLLRDDFIDDPTMEPDFKYCPIMLPLLNTKEEPGLNSKCVLNKVDKKENLTISDVLCEPSIPSDPGFIFFELPNGMPGLKMESQDSSARHNTHPAASTAQPTDIKFENERCTLSWIPGGHIGTLQIMKSGRARLVFGSIRMWLEMGTQIAFTEELVSADLSKDTLSGDMIEMGPVSARIVANPDWVAMMADDKTSRII